MNMCMANAIDNENDINKNNINIAIDVDGTLTKEKISVDIMVSSPSEIEKAMLNCIPKDGIDILFENNDNKYIITGRLERYREVTIDWLDMYGIPYKDMTMFPNNFYDTNGYSIPKYVEYKLYIHLRKSIHFSLDDNIHVVEALNKCGIYCYHVENNFKDAFEKVLKLKNDNRLRKNRQVNFQEGEKRKKE